ncbi:HAD family hydrolase [Kinneretia aquatilis]|uniref:HAD family hydrolase n=1 Tax=Kinneretia aquatilis TaxID=2070761 RepID=UPI00149538BF|nr:HAD family hydrolase [Paucibacter aquatile]WIV97501.1 HAD family hydrolase [Paucibacter aquatile]
MGKPYTDELLQLPATIQWAAAQDIALLHRALHLYNDRGLLAVGSGGSFTAAAFAADQHFRVYGRPSQAITPLEVFHVPTSASASAAGLLLSAEGKNNDILAAAKQLRLRACPSIGLTLRATSPLVKLCDETGAASLAIYDMPWGKDGYLATNSLVATLILLWRAYAAATEVADELPQLADWYREFDRRLGQTGALKRSGRALILHGAVGRIGAIDLESKLTEGALAYGQVCNFRQFAHGRHLQLSQLTEPVTVVSFSAEGDLLAAETAQLLPAQVGPVLHVTLPSISAAGAEIAGVMASMALTRAWAGEHVDPGQPVVPQFGRALHALDVSTLVSQTLPPSPAMLRKQCSGDEPEALVEHARRYIDRLKAAELRLLVCDFDGTFCDTVKRFDGLDEGIATELTRLLHGGLHMAIATGRGAKLRQVLRQKLPEEVWGKVTVGCYSGSFTFNLADQAICKPPADPRLDELAEWLRKTRALSVQVEPCVDAGQLSMRGVSGSDKVRLLAAINEWVTRKGQEGWRAFSSGHSVDVVTEKAGKLLVVQTACSRLGLAPLTQVLRVGDAGDFGGNDYELLSEGLALSVDAVPPGVEQCWNLLPRMLSGVRGTEYYLQGLEAVGGEARFSAEFLSQAELVVRESLGRN